MHAVELHLYHGVNLADPDAEIDYHDRLLAESRHRDIPLHFRVITDDPSAAPVPPLLVVAVDDIPDSSHRGVLDETALRELLDSYTNQPAGCW